jgi:hypothetical protein
MVEGHLTSMYTLDAAVPYRAINVADTMAVAASPKARKAASALKKSGCGRSHDKQKDKVSLQEDRS